MRWNNETPLPRPPVLDHGTDSTLPSRDSGRDIPVRIFKPDDGKIRGTFLHIHGGGWVLQSEKYQDTYLDNLSKQGLAVISIGYRLAPEYPFPAGPEDCYDVADYLVANAEHEFGGPLLFIGGESAGGHLSALTLLHLHNRHKSFVLPGHGGLVLHFGCFDLSTFLPSALHFPQPLIIDYKIMKGYQEVFLPNTTAEQRADPSISPLYADWKKIAAEMRSRGASGLPRALFTVGTEDPLLDDSVFMAAKWQMCGGEGILKVYPGAAHGFIGFAGQPDAEDAHKTVLAFVSK
jgi:acetyl esterase/lipase